MDRPPFISLGGTSEMLFARQCGYHPIGFVHGECVISLAVNQTTGLDGCENPFITQGIQNAVETAISRAKESAQSLGALGVTNLKLEYPETLGPELVVIAKSQGTAVAGEPSIHHREPFLTTLDGSELMIANQWGYAPLGLAIGVSFYQQIPSYRSSGIRMGMNIEHPDYTRATIAARNLAMGRANAMAESLGAEGLIGMTVKQRIDRPRDDAALKISFVVIGTAVKRDPFIKAPPFDIQQTVSL